MTDKEIFQKAYKKAINGGLSGFGAMTFQVGSLMWLRTIVNFQYRNGGTFINTYKTLYKQGGIFRFYRGLPFALMQAPLSRFGDTAMNIGVMSLLENSDMNTASKTFIGSCGAATWRMCIMPIDTCKTTMQVNGSEGLKLLKNKVRTNGPSVLYHGSLASASSTLVGHFPWFFTYNYLNEQIPQQEGYKKLLRSAVIGFSSSSISDICSNSLRVIKTNRQTSASSVSYVKLVKNIVENDSLLSLFTRGLKTKIITNGIQGMCFTVMFDYLRKN
tara:strand:+ start:69 stop:887 length:819 start_codon:yes stop_codon:yes gene_type:complete